MGEYLTAPYEPVEVTQIEMAFPTDVRRLMPDPDTIDLQNLNGWGVRLQRDWFFNGIGSLDANWKVDSAAALRHLSTLQGSWEPKHEHKEAAVAFLLEQWIDGEPTWERGDRDG